MEDEVSAGQKIGLAVQRGEDPSQFETQLDSAKSQAEQAGTAYGFKECGAAITASSSTPSTGGSSSSSSGGSVVTPSAPSTGSAGGTSGGGTSGGSGGIGPG
jgi:hypothetical protein